LCPELARFANASRTAGVHRVVLEGGWGDCPHSDHENNENGGPTMWCQRCEHGGFPAGKALCAYLLENTSWEFPNINLRRALDCLGWRAPAPPESLPESARFDAAPRLERGVSVLIELDQRALAITAGPTQALPRTGR